MTGKLKGRTAIVTGAGQGVGRGIALALAAEGANVVVAVRRAETGEAVVAEIADRGGTGISIETDVTNRAAVNACVARTVEHFGSLEIMVHNAYKGGSRHTLEEVDEAFWSPFSRTAMWASYYCAQEIFPHLKEAGAKGRFVLVTSTSGVDGSTHLPIYAPVKAAQRALAKCLAHEWGPYGITVNCLAPVALTPELLANFERTPSLRDQVESGIPLGRIGDPERDIGRVAAFLVSDDAGYVTGQTAVSNGGIFTGL